VPGLPRTNNDRESEFRDLNLACSPPPAKRDWWNASSSVKAPGNSSHVPTRCVTPSAPCHGSTQMTSLKNGNEYVPIVLDSDFILVRQNALRLNSNTWSNAGKHCRPSTVH